MGDIVTALYLLKKLKLPPPFFTDIIFLPAVYVAGYQVSRGNKNKSKNGFSVYVPQFLPSFLYGRMT
jgi:hypothetical protein